MKKVSTVATKQGRNLSTDDRFRPRQFGKSRDVGCYLGLQPGRRNSGQSEPQMHISKEGDPYMRTLLVQ
jgi:transposase